MPRPDESPDIRASKTLAYILRHGAEKEGLYMRKDGYIKLNDVLARPKLRDVDKDMVLRLVHENAKKRFEVIYGYDPTPPIPKKSKQKQKQKQKPTQKQRDVNQDDTQALNGDGREEAEDRVDGPKENDLKIKDDEPGGSAGKLIDKNGVGPDDSVLDNGKGGNGIDPARIEDLQSRISNINMDSLDNAELSLVEMPIPPVSSSLQNADFQADVNSDQVDKRGEYFIRASQGHSIKLDDTAHLELISKNDEEGQKKVGLMVHGTKWSLWKTLKEEGLSKMQRSHIHLAPALSSTDHHITPRPTSTLLIYLNLEKMLRDGIPAYVSANGVILTPGDKDGLVRKEYWRKAERVKGGLEGDKVLVWDGEKEITENI